MVNQPQFEREALELHDSDVVRVDVTNGRAEIAVSPGIVHRSIGIPGVNAGTEWTIDLTIVIDSVVVEGEFGEFPCELTDGTLSVDGKIQSNCIGLPLDRAGIVILQLQPKWSEHSVTFRGSRIQIIKTGEPKYLQDFRSLTS